MRLINYSITVVLFIFLIMQSFATEDVNNKTVTSKIGSYDAIDEKTKKIIEKKITSIDKTVVVNAVEKSPVEGICAAIINHGQPIYVTVDGNYLITGEMIEINDTKGAKNLTNEVKGNYLTTQLKALTKEEVISFRPDKNPKAVIYVFTDVNCFYCKKLHQDIPKLNELQIEVKFLAFPRKKQPSVEYQNIVNVWAATNPKLALENAMLNKDIAQASMQKSSTVQDIIEKQLSLGIHFGITGTPAIILETGEVLSGYLPPEAIAKKLNIIK